MKKQKKQPQMAFCIKINKQKSINANKTKNQHGCEKHNSHKYTKHTHTHTYRGVHLRDTQKYAIKKELTHANCHSSHKCRKWAFAGRVKSVAHIFIAYIFVYSEYFFFSFLHLLHKLPMKLQNICRWDGTQLGSFVAVITLWPNRCAERCEAGEITIINQFAKKNTHISQAI